MSVPFSNTHLRIPRGFGTILEGLAREILRDQPEDIPKYAAQYFDVLLKQREESGMDPAEWAAKLEDRFYNNHAFKATGASPEKELAPEIAISKEKSFECQTEDESSHSAQASNLSISQPNVSEEVDLAESTQEEGKHDITEKHIISVEKRLSEGESINRLPAADVQSDELSGTEEEKDPTINTLEKVDRAANEKDSSSVPDQVIHQSESTNLLSFSGVSNVDVCAQELGMAKDEGGDKQDSAVVDKEITGSEREENTEVEEPVEVFPYSEQADVDVCATELGGTERIMEIATVENDIHVVEEESLNPQPAETLARSSLSQFETTEGNQQEAKTKEEEGTETEASSEETHQSLAHIEGGLDSSTIPKEDSLVEISFEDVPEAQQITEVGEKQPEEEGSVEVLQTKILEMQQEEDSNYVTAVATDQNISGLQYNEEPEMEGAEKEFKSEREEMESQHEASDIMKEKVDTHAPNLNHSDDNDEKGEGVSSLHQLTTEADEENPEVETDHTNEDNEKIREGKLCQNEDSEKETKSNDLKEDERTDTDGGDKEDIHTEGYSEMEDEDVNDGGVENHSSQVTQSYTTAAAMEAESETLEASAQHLPEDSQRSLVESQAKDTVEEKEVTSKEEEDVVEEGKIDSEVQEKSEGESISRSADRTGADHHGEERPPGSERDATEPGGKSSDKVTGFTHFYRP
ncbi:enolase-phosphatase E1-like isoform X1 [Seriola aureovittata]|uniref:enolase-phosphatase E1-like isoform X1 n=2 Tax=Seriola TaxID=8160 RepID=UPI0024BECC1C|nr:enolase-phosphatase E1-like isoform X1 [Seriola aureovittata]XP_056230895.1 enolase-phosphatase E1-like isoform X1 [Seriola aureovittata]